MAELEDTQTLSTTIDTDPRPSEGGAGAMPLTDPRSDVEAVFREAAVADEDKPDKPDEVKPEDAKEKAEPEKGKDEAKPDAKAAAVPEKEAGKAKEPEPKAGEEASKPEADAAPKAEAESKDETKGRYHEPPRNFLPDARDVWRNVPNAVRREIDTMVREHEARAQEFKQVGERYEAVRAYDDLARQNGRELKDSLAQVVEFENLMRANPIAALNMALQQAGPRKNDGQPLSLFEVAQAVVQMGQQGYQQAAARMPQQQQQGPSEVERLTAEVDALKAQMTLGPIIERFASRNPRYGELQNEIAHFLKSGMIPESLPPEERLAAAYDMAVRIRPASTVANDRHSDPGPASDAGRAGQDFGGSKSIKSSPGSVTEEVEDFANRGESVEDSIREAAKRLRRA